MEKRKTKRCTKCKIEKELSKFYRRTMSYDGLTSMCKECIKARQNKYYQSGRGKKVVKAYRNTARGQEVQARANAKYEASKKGKARRRRQAEEMRKKKGWKKRKGLLFGKRFEGEEGRREYQRLYGKHIWKTRRKQRQAQNFVGGMVRRGKIPAASTLNCVECREEGHKKKAREYHHYRGYDREHWLDIISLCTKCHRRLHREMDQ